MQKTLIAIAALACLTAVAHAEVSLTGQLSYGYRATHDNLGNDASGFGVETDNSASALNFLASEDLGAGQKIAAQYGFASVVRNNAANGGSSSSYGVVGGDSKISYTNNAFGQIELGSAKEADIFTPIAYGGANLIQFDGKLNQIRTVHDYLTVVTKNGPWLVRYKFSEAGNDSVLGEGVGTQGSATTVGQQTNDFTFAYLTDTLKAGIGYRKYSNPDETGGIFNGNSLTKRDVIHAELGYDFGFVKLGAGYDHVNASWGVTQDNTLVGFSVPAGNWLFGAAWEQSKAAGVTDASVATVGPLSGATAAFVKNALNQVDGTSSGVSLGAQYAFSKRTKIALRYATWTVSGYEQFERFGIDAATRIKNGASQTSAISSALSLLGYKQNESQTDLTLTHSF